MRSDDGARTRGHPVRDRARGVTGLKSRTPANQSPPLFLRTHMPSSAHRCVPIPSAAEFAQIGARHGRPRSLPSASRLLHPLPPLPLPTPPREGEGEFEVTMALARCHMLPSAPSFTPVTGTLLCRRSQSCCCSFTHPSPPCRSGRRRSLMGAALDAPYIFFLSLGLLPLQEGELAREIRWLRSRDVPLRYHCCRPTPSTIWWSPCLAMIMAA